MCSDPILIRDEELLNNTSAKTPHKAEQRESVGKNLPQEKLFEKSRGKNKNKMKEKKGSDIFKS